MDAMATANGDYEAGDELPTESANSVSTGSLKFIADAFTVLNSTLLEIKRSLQDDPDYDSDHMSEEKVSEEKGSEEKGPEEKRSEEDETDSVPTAGPDWHWQVLQEYRTRSGRVKVRKGGDGKKGKSSDKTWIPFEVVYGLKDNMWPLRDSINIFSPSLMEIIVRLDPRLHYDSSEGSLRVYAGSLFQIRQKLEDIGLNGVDAAFPGNALSSSDADTGNQQLHVRHLLRFMETELKDVLKRYSAMEAGRCVSWDMLWAFFPPGAQVVYHCNITGETLLGIVTDASYELESHQVPHFNISIKMWDYDCSTWQSYETSESIYAFDGERGFPTLQTFPLRFQDNAKEVEKEILARGESFSYLSMQVRNRFMNYKGLIYMMRGGCALKREDASGRVMLDLASFQRMNPDYPMGNANPPGEVLRDNKVELIDISSKEDRLYAPAMVYGFSFRLKAWGTFLVRGFSEVVFNDKAFDALVMPKPRKQLVETLVSQYVRKASMVTTGESVQAQQAEEVDPIASKGEGCIILCYGGPGTGKTLTAESLSEKLHAPLWSVSVSELGTMPQELEAYLVRVLDIAFTWGAILLLDEADVYLEKRSSFDMTRTAMAGIFLRNLEYYRGVLFLTSNRVVAFDDAFRSRISMILYYEISKDERQTIWETMLNRVNINFPEQVLATFAQEELNGRDIRNVVHRAMILAKANQRSLNVEYIQQSLDDLVLSLKVLAQNCKEMEISSLT